MDSFGHPSFEELMVFLYELRNKTQPNYDGQHPNFERAIIEEIISRVECYEKVKQAVPLRTEIND